MGASSTRPSTSSREMASRTEKRHHGNPQLKARGEMAPFKCVDTSPRTWTRPRHSSTGGTQACGQFGSSFQAMGDFQGPEVDVLLRAKQAAQTRPFKEQLAQNDASIQRSQKRIASLERGRAKNRRCWTRVWFGTNGLKQEVAAAEPVPVEVPMQESSTEVMFFRVKVAQLEAKRVPHPVQGSIDAVVVDEAQDRELSKGQFTDESTRSSFLVGGEAVVVARCPRCSRHGISQFVDGTDFQRRLCHEQFVAAVFGGAHGALIGAWREVGYGRGYPHWRGGQSRSSEGPNHLVGW